MSRNYEEIADELRRVVGPDRVSTNPIDKKLHGISLTYFLNYWEPDIVVIPESDPGGNNPIPRILSIANKHQVPVTAKGGIGMGSSNPQEGGIMIDMMGMDKILEINKDQQYIVLEAGTSIYEVEKELLKYDLHFPVYGTYGSGAVAAGTVINPSHGFGSTSHGIACDLLTGVELALVNGDVVRFGSLANQKTKFGPFMRYPNGPDFVGLMVQSSGAYGIITKMAFELIHLKREYLTDYCYAWRRDQIDQFQRALIEQTASGIYDIHFNDRWAWQAAIEEGIYTEEEIPKDLWFFLTTMTLARTPKDKEAKEEIMREIYERNGGVEVKAIAEKHMGADAQKHGLHGWPAWWCNGPDGWCTAPIRAGGCWAVTSRHFPLSFFKETYELSERALHAAGLWDLEHSPFHDSYCIKGQRIKEEWFVHFNPYDPEEMGKIGMWAGMHVNTLCDWGAMIHPYHMPLHPRSGLEKLGAGYEWIKDLKRRLDPNNILNPGKIM